MVTNGSISFQGFKKVLTRRCFYGIYFTSGIQIEFPLAQMALWLTHTKGKLDRSGMKMPNILPGSISLKDEYFDFIVLAN